MYQAASLLQVWASVLELRLWIIAPEVERHDNGWLFIFLEVSRHDTHPEEEYLHVIEAQQKGKGTHSCSNGRENFWSYTVLWKSHSMQTIHCDPNQFSTWSLMWLGCFITTERETISKAVDRSIRTMATIPARHRSARKKLRIFFFHFKGRKVVLIVEASAF